MLKIRLVTAALLVALLGAFVLAPSLPAAAATNPFVGIPVTGSIPSNGGSFTGTLNVTRFTSSGGQLAAVGTLSGTLLDALGNTIGTVSNVPVRVPVAASGSCQILHLDLGPLDLNLLGLQVHLNRVVLDITAQQAPGNLLGNLLCAVAHLLDQSPLPVAGLAQLLNQILAIL